jgi:iron(III) transport system ATP-binding protein
MPELVIENVHKWLGNLHILKGVSVTAEKGSILALLGASGSGKTTLLRCVAGLVQPEMGRVEIGDRVVVDHEKGVFIPPESRNIGLVFQSYALWPHRTVKENVGYGLKLRGVDATALNTRIQHILDKLGLGDLGDRYPDQLSGGQQQRVAICRSLIYEPRVLLLDEPLSNLDAKLREEARYFIRNLIRELGLCAILVTHDQAEALAVADQILLLKDGVNIQQGTPTEIYSRPKSFYAADFLGSNNIVEGKVQAQGSSARIFGENWSLDGIVMDEGLPATQSGKAVIRVEQISVHLDAGSARVPMELEDCLYLGGHWEYRLKLGGLHTKAVGKTRLPAGKVFAEIPRESVWIYR